MTWDSLPKRVKSCVFSFWDLLACRVSCQRKERLHLLKALAAVVAKEVVLRSVNVGKLTVFERTHFFLQLRSLFFERHFSEPSLFCWGLVFLAARLGLFNLLALLLNYCWEPWSSTIIVAVRLLVWRMRLIVVEPKLEKWKCWSVHLTKI